jgi:hypothetical protein
MRHSYMRNGIAVVAVEFGLLGMILALAGGLAVLSLGLSI